MVTQPSGSFVEGQPITVPLTITNKGPAAATGITGTVTSKSGATFTAANSPEWDTLKRTPLAPKEVRPVTLTVSFTGAKAAKGEFEIAVKRDGETEPSARSRKSLTVGIVEPATKGKLGGLVYTDKNDSATFDEGEGFANVQVTVSGPRGDHKATTDAHGRFEVGDLPAGWYTVSVPSPMPGGWLAAGQSVAVDGKGQHVELRGIRPLSEGLVATVKFDGGPYKTGDTANLTITLTNNGSRVAKNIIATCEIDRPEHLEGTEKPANWGELASGGDGLTLKPGEAVTRKVHGTVPEKSRDHGVVSIVCEFRDKNSAAKEGNPFIFTLAKVPGANGVGTGLFFHDKDLNNQKAAEEPGVASLPVTLLDPLDGHVVASATSAKDGRYHFAGIPAGWYIPVPHGPWAFEKNEFLVVKAGAVEDRNLALVRGPLRADLGSVPKPATPPAEGTQDSAQDEDRSQDRSQNRSLANTGANVIGLTIVGAVVLLLGVGAVLVTRRRRRG